MNFETILTHGGWKSEEDTRACAVPIYQTSSFTLDDTQYAKELFDGTKTGNIYTRIMNPTTDILEKRVAMLEGGVGAIATSSGMSALLITALTILKAGDEIVSSSALYGGSFNLLDVTLRKFGINTIFIESDDPKDFENAITEKTRMIYGETLANPRLTVFDIENVAKIAHKHNIPLVLDNTIPTPYLLKPIEWGCDIVIHSATKYLGGHGNSIAGIIVDSGNFNWEESGKFETLKGFKGADAFIQKARADMLRDTGACLSPFNAFMILQGIQTLALRMEKHTKNAEAVAKYLKESPYISWVNHPMFKEDEKFKKYLPKGTGGMLGFGIKGGFEAGSKFIDNVKLLIHIANIGDTRTLVIHPASTTHQQMSEEDRIKCGVPNDFIRMSVGIEDTEDIIKDIEQALEIACK